MNTYMTGATVLIIIVLLTFNVVSLAANHNYELPKAVKFSS